MRKKLAILATASLIMVGTMIGLTSGTALSVPPPAPVPVPAAIASQAPDGFTGVQQQPAVKPNTVNAPAEQAKGATKTIKINDKTGAPVDKIGIAADASVSLGTPYNYAWHEFVYTPVSNTSAVTKYFQVQLYVPGQASYRQFYSYVNAGSTAYPYFYGVTGTYYAYLYVWNGSSYVYDEYTTSANNTSVGVSVASSVYSGYVLATIKNYGNNYVTVNSQELAPYSTYGTYTGGPHYDYPVAGGGTIYRYYYVGTGQRYGIVADVDGSSPYNSFRFSGVY